MGRAGGGEGGGGGLLGIGASVSWRWRLRGCLELQSQSTDRMSVSYMEDFSSALSDQVLAGPATKLSQSDAVEGVSRYPYQCPAATLSQLLW